LNIPSDAPPAFLLDANRQGNGRKPWPDDFDNRSVSFTTDFPSGTFLRTHRVHRVILVQKSGAILGADLAHILRRWQDGGIRIERVWFDAPALPELLQVPRPSWYRIMFQRALASFGLHRASGGGFGAWIPEASSGG